jgi:hypothetical protein|tara:strand:+ start:1603 stop:1812 length:210 start_codon:yes stop_codon:yes gene_type:complete
MTPEYKAALKNKLVETDYSQLPDVVNRLTGDSFNNLQSYRTLIRNEMLELTTYFTIETIPASPLVEWVE